MAKLTKFTISPSGQLVYKSTGKLAPEGYTFRKNTVYGPNGRRIGSLSRKLTKTEASKIAKAEKRRFHKKAGGKKGAGAPQPPTPQKPAKPSKKTEDIARVQEAEETLDDFEGEDFEDTDQAIIEEFQRRVRDAALSVAPQWLSDRIRALSSRALWLAYEQNDYIFEKYFQYHQPTDAPHKSDVSMWLYQFTLRVEQYMDVME